MHTNEDSLVCQQCDVKFFQKSELNQHIYNQHILRKHTVEMQFACEQCGRLFSEQNSLNHHMQMHSEENHHIIIQPNNAGTLNTNKIHSFSLKLEDGKSIKVECEDSIQTDNTEASNAFANDFNTIEIEDVHSIKIED